MYLRPILSVAENLLTNLRYRHLEWLATKRKGGRNLDKNEHRPLLACKRLGIAEAKWPGDLTRDIHLPANYILNPSPLFRVRFSSY